MKPQHIGGETVGVEAFTRRGVLAGIAGVSVLPATPAVSAPRVRTKIGFNCYDLFLDGFLPGGQFGMHKLEALGRRQIPFVRFPASAQWAQDWLAYTENPKAYWAGMDQIFAAAEHSGVGLVASVLWHPSALAFYFKEPMQAWADPTSQTRRLAAQFTAEIVSRYDSSPALLMWEFGNELNDWLDLPNVLQFWPKADPTMPGRKRTDLDRLKTTDFVSAVGAFANVVRAHGKKPVGAGTNEPRSNALHLMRGSLKNDTPAEFVEAIRLVTPRNCNVLSIHAYASRYGRADQTFKNLNDLLSAFIIAASKDNRISFVGEFGTLMNDNPAAEQLDFHKIIDTISRSGINYAAVWNYDRRVEDQFTVSPTNRRSYQLDAVVAANRA